MCELTRWALVPCFPPGPILRYWTHFHQKVLVHKWLYLIFLINHVSTLFVYYEIYSHHQICNWSGEPEEVGLKIGTRFSEGCFWLAEREDPKLKDMMEMSGRGPNSTQLRTLWCALPVTIWTDGKKMIWKINNYAWRLPPPCIMHIHVENC